MDDEFNTFSAFEFNNATAHLWVFKNSTAEKKYRAWYVPTDEDFTAEMKSIAVIEQNRITEHSPYSPLSQSNETSCLSISKDETDFQLLENQISKVEAENRADGIRILQGAKGYAVKFIHNGTIVYAIKRSTTSWKTAYSKKRVNLIFANGELAIAEDNNFSIEKNFDFFSTGNGIFVSNKRSFESIMQFKTVYEDAFAQLQADIDFQSVFLDLAPIVQHVGTNAMHLRRMAVIADRMIFSHPNFLPNLQRVNAARNWGINFDAQSNTIIPCEATARVILQVLLDHRLTSEVTDHIYDVPDATPV
ncbi:MAG: DUF4868 domain-containing protein [marine bacterium B5-7]|nr:MAG: DUF4868 domain-containing protein [marine bacterium B5-7]